MVEQLAKLDTVRPRGVANEAAGHAALQVFRPAGAAGAGAARHELKTLRNEMRHEHSETRRTLDTLLLRVGGGTPSTAGSNPPQTDRVREEDRGQDRTRGMDRGHRRTAATGNRRKPPLFENRPAPDPHAVLYVPHAPISFFHFRNP